jgi:peptide/nickel transport system substrate-binding protein
LQPLLVRDPASAAFVANHYSAPLLRRNPETLDWDATEGTAAAVMIADGGRTVTYTLRDGLKWSDGTPITARDYQFTYQRMIDPAIDHPYRPIFAIVTSVDAPDDQTLTWTFGEAFCPAIDYTVINPIPRHVFEGADLARHPASTRPTVGSGPFLLEQWNPGRDATFSANPSFYLGRPRLDRYMIRLVADAAQGWAVVKADEADIAAIQASDADEVASTTGPQVVAHYPATSSWTYLGINLRHRVLADRTVRQAIAHAVDRDAIVRKVRHGHARTIDTPFGSGSWATTSVPAMNFDPAKSNRLLDDAGWAVGDAGVRAKDGVSLTLTLRFPTGNREREHIATLISANLRAVGIALQLIAEPLNALIYQVSVARDFDLCVLGWTMPIEPHGTREVWASNGTQNASGLADGTIDSLYDEAMRLIGCGRDGRRAAYGEIQRRVADAIPCVFLFETESLAVTSNRVAVNPTTRLGWDYRPWLWTARG